MTSIEYIEKLELVINRLREVELVTILTGKEIDYTSTIEYFTYKRDEEWKRYFATYKFLK